MQQTQRAGRGSRAATQPADAPPNRSASPPLRSRGNGSRKQKGRAVGALWGMEALPVMQAVLAALYFVLFRQPPGQQQRALTARVASGTQESMAAASEILRRASLLSHGHLLPRLVQAAALHRHKRPAVAAALAEALAEAGVLPPHAAQPIRSAGNRSSESSSGGAQQELERTLKGLVAGFRAAAPTLECPWDATLPRNPARHGKLLIAANLKDSEALMPHLILQLLALLVYLPPRSAYLSIYESGSSDSTGTWLAVLREFVARLPHPNRLMSGGPLRRREGQDRIDFLVHVRNAALAPLWQAKPWKADRVVFLNDVWLCAADVVRLLSHEDAHLACGMDFDRPRINQMPRQVQRQLFADMLARRLWLPRLAGRALGRWTLLLRQWRDAPATERSFQATAPMQLYDIWVTRDIGGHHALKTPPYLQDETTAEQLARGLPVPVSCCWNGLVVLDAAPLTAGLRMRSHQPGECAASECSLLCADYSRLGRSRMVLDPGVRLAYHLREATGLQSERGSDLVSLHNSSWADVAAATPIQWPEVKHPDRVDCCALKPGKDSIVFEEDCAPEAVSGSSAQNFTAAALTAAAVVL